MNRLYLRDYERFTPHKYNFFASLVRRIRNHELQYIFLGRKYALAKNRIAKKLLGIRLRVYRRKYGLEMNFSKIGAGLRLIHPWCITVNDNAVLGEDVTLYKGVTIGEILYGSRAGVPTIGNHVTIYPNAQVCGNVKISDGAIISSGAFVNFDVPEKAVVIGNPGVIHMPKNT